VGYDASPCLPCVRNNTPDSKHLSSTIRSVWLTITASGRTLAKQLVEVQKNVVSTSPVQNCEVLVVRSILRDPLFLSSFRKRFLRFRFILPRFC